MAGWLFIRLPGSAITWQLVKGAPPHQLLPEVARLGSGTVMTVWNPCVSLKDVDFSLSGNDH